MKYHRCMCGKAEMWESGMPIHPCMGCDKCYTSFAQTLSGHKPLEPHQYETYYMGGKDPNPVQKCKVCDHIDRKKPNA